MRQAKFIISCRLKPDADKAEPAVWNLMRTGQGNKISEAARQEILDRNASEGIEPRNVPSSKRPTVFIYWKAAKVCSLKVRAHFLFRGLSPRYEIKREVIGTWEILLSAVNV